MNDALRLADALDELDPQFYSTGLLCEDAAAELRRLHDVNAELVEALKAMSAEFDSGDVNDGEWAAIQKARAAIAKATGEQQ